MLYKYKAINSHGNKKMGAIIAKNYPDAYEILSKKNLQPIKIEQQYFSSKKIDVEDILLFFLHVEFQLKCGAHINEAVDSFLDFHGNDVFNATLLEVSNDLKNGERISHAFEKNCEFNSVIIGLLRAAENTGRLTNTISCILDWIKLQKNWKSQIQNILAYPIFIVVIALMILFVSSHILGPQVISLIKNYGDAQVPFLTIFAVDILPALSKFFGIFIVALIAIFSVLMTSKIGFNWIMKLALKIPIIKNIIRKITLWQLFKILHISYVSKVDFMMAFSLAINSLSIEPIKNELMDLQNEIAEGRKIAACFSKIVPTDISMAIFIGEEGNNLEQSFEHISEKIYDDLMADIKFFGNALSVGLTLFTGLIFVFILCSMFQPIYDYIGRAGA